MSETFILSQRDSSILYRFISDHGRDHSEILDPSFRNFEKFKIIGTLENRKLIQAAFSKFDDDSAITRIVGIYSDETIKILNILCAISASHTPEIIHHSFIVPLSNVYNFSQVYAKSRLGTYTESREMVDGTIKVSICYPK
jgi:hypothetical protein